MQLVRLAKRAKNGTCSEFAIILQLCNYKRNPLPVYWSLNTLESEILRFIYMSQHAQFNIPQKESAALDG